MVLETLDVGRVDYIFEFEDALNVKVDLLYVMCKVLDLIINTNTTALYLVTHEFQCESGNIHLVVAC